MRREEKPRAISKTGEQAKEEAMELLRSGAIQISDKKDRHTFKRKSKDADDEDTLARTPIKVVSTLEKTPTYSNFLKGPKILPHYSHPRESDSGGGDARSLSSPELQSTPTTGHSSLEVAASKRKQQLLSLCEEDVEEEHRQEKNIAELDVSRNNHQGLEPRSLTCDDVPRVSTPFSSRSTETTLYVAYHKVTTEFIHEVFDSLGTILRIRIGEHQNYAYVTMATREMARAALELDHQMVHNRLLRVAYARRQFPRTRRDSRGLDHSSPRSPYARRPYNPRSYNAVPPSESLSGPKENSRDLVTYEDLYSSTK